MGMIILPFGNSVIHIPVSTWWINNRTTFSLVDIYYISAAGWELVQLKALVGRSTNGCLPSPCQDAMSWWKRKCFWGLKVKWNSHTDFSVMSVSWLWILVAVLWMLVAHGCGFCCGFCYHCLCEWCFQKHDFVFAMLVKF